MEYWKVKTDVIRANSYRQVRNIALRYYRELAHRTKRTPYIRSKHFGKHKIFLHHFWQHLFEKNPKDRTRRLRFFICAIELLQSTTYKPEINKPMESAKITWYRFFGETRSGLKFTVQIKESKKGQLFLMSVFPYKKTHR